MAWVRIPLLSYLFALSFYFCVSFCRAQVLFPSLTKQKTHFSHIKRRSIHRILGMYALLNATIGLWNTDYVVSFYSLHFHLPPPQNICLRRPKKK
ncbi:hypothetical protein P170DRAFT_155620 [Aspergillus steynii IBT 23096]|uniref:Uncharacterized protein n=1 Tax=Aspergillus steynii IBT 23096 TaxID=1392250 RepID=A0A2I2GDE4_9EURO|nr:uncharacterized protein P170DRAFT_155620 [Aspergillus steynii IBT 23096]PLB50914.1 hypothetical protein P170DRAFT_155620 [Aspergillus steynii IBT 23096]